eukprot:1149266-Pelagomonas_calceolata.AAC.2
MFQRRRLRQVGNTYFLVTKQGTGFWTKGIKSRAKGYELLDRVKGTKCKVKGGWTAGQRALRVRVQGRGCGLLDKAGQRLFINASCQKAGAQASGL